MALKWKQSLAELKERLEAAGLEGQWSEEAGGKHVFREADGGILNWWSSTGSVQFQGPAVAKGTLEQAITSESSSPLPQSTGKSTNSERQIFIVHGHDAEARDQLELSLRRLGLEPFILMNTSGGGKTIIEALEGQIGRDHSSDFGIVLMTPDDFGYSKKDGADKAEPRARQNVILEAGMLLSSLTRTQMAIVVKGHLEMPSDLQGVIHLGYNEHIKEIVPKLCQRLKEAGFYLDTNKIAAAAQ